MVYEREGREAAVELTNLYGNLIGACCKANGLIVLKFERGIWNVPKEFIFKYGYSGSGTDCFHAFLQASGLNVSKDQVVKAREGDIFTK